MPVVWCEQLGVIHHVDTGLGLESPLSLELPCTQLALILGCLLGLVPILWVFGLENPLMLFCYDLCMIQ